MSTWTLAFGLGSCLLLGSADATPQVAAQTPAPNTSNALDRPPTTKGGSTPKARPQSLADLDIEQLLNTKVQVTSASKKEESLFGAPAAIFVLTGEDIRRGGFSSIPEALRMVPGLTVTQINSHLWTVSSRGFNGFPNEKMLVLIDGRATYDPLYGGVFWDLQDVPLNDIERIEVIRGPGGTLWGANAVNGIINISTKTASRTPGVTVAISVGHDEGYTASVGYGGQVGADAAYRLYGKASYWDPFVTSSGAELYNAWNNVLGGVRADWKPGEHDTLTFEGGGYSGRERDIETVTTYTAASLTPLSIVMKGGDILGRWGHTFSNRSSIDLKAYCDWSSRSDIFFGFERRNTCDIELQHDFRLSPRHSLIWGGNFRTTSDRALATFQDAFNPLSRRQYLESSFAQYELAVVPGRFRIIGGAKFENTTFTGFDLQPQIRAVWSPSSAHNVWAAVSRSVRIPTRNEHDNFLVSGSIPGSPPTFFIFVGNPNLVPEHQIAYELGYRYQPLQSLSFDTAIFYNSYTDLIYPDFVNLTPFFNADPPFVGLAIPFTNLLSAQTHGLEFSTKWKATRFWLWSGALTENRGTGVSRISMPRHQANIQSRMDLPHHLEFNSALYYYNGKVIPYPVGVTFVEHTTNRVDLGLSWRPVPQWTLAVWGRNLQSRRHEEDGALYFVTGQVRRAVVFQATWHSSPEPTAH
jgi:iron complex outermembrane receptor protein